MKGLKQVVGSVFLGRSCSACIIMQVLAFCWLQVVRPYWIFVICLFLFMRFFRLCVFWQQLIKLFQLHINSVFNNLCVYDFNWNWNIYL